MNDDELIIGDGEYKLMTYVDLDCHPDNHFYIFRNEMKIPWQIDLAKGLEKKQFDNVYVYNPVESMSKYTKNTN